MQDAKNRESKEHKARVRERVAELMGGGAPPAGSASEGGAISASGAPADADAAAPTGMDEAAAHEIAEAEWAAGADALESVRLEREAEAAEFPAELRAEKDRL